MAHSDAREGKWREKGRMECVTSILHTTTEYGVSSITSADTHISAASSLLNWRPCRFKWIRPFRRKTKSGFCACAITFQTQSSIFRPVQLVLIFTDSAQYIRLNVIFNYLLGFSRIFREFFPPRFCVHCLYIYCVHMPDNYSFLDFIILKSER
jgi:hypothetical protein